MGLDLIISLLAAVFSGAVILSIPESGIALRYRVRHRLSGIRGMSGKEENRKKKPALYERMLVPAAEALIHNVSLLLPVNEKTQERLRTQLTLAGRHTSPRDYAAVSALIVAGSALGTGILLPVLSVDYPFPLLALLGAYGGFAVRRFSLSGAITRRREAIESELPGIIDLLAVSTTVGLGFDQAVAYVTEQCSGVFAEEMRLARQQLGMGRSKREALGDLALRCGVDEVTTFVSSVLQAEEVGISMHNILDSQASAIRQAHRQKVEAKAAQLPIKILLPIVIFIFPVLFIVLVGPSVPALLEVLG